MTEPERLCPECGRPIFGRADKKYCSDACRSAHNNRQISEADELIRKVNRRLKKNRSILAKLNPTGKTTLPKDKLLKEGFDFQYFTHHYVTKDQREYRFC